MGQGLHAGLLIYYLIEFHVLSMIHALCLYVFTFFQGMVACLYTGQSGMSISIYYTIGHRSLYALRYNNHVHMVLQIWGSTCSSD